MLQLLYISSARRAIDDAGIDAIVKQSVRNNGTVGISGLLWTDGKRFLQVLEGDEEAVRDTFARIAADPRHTGIVKLHERAVTGREFGRWAMARRTLGEASTAFEGRMSLLLQDASPAVRGTFEGLIAARAAA